MVRGSWVDAHHGILRDLKPVSQTLHKHGTIQYEVAHTISPHTTLCLCRPLRPLPVKNPSLPATRSLQSLAICCTILPVSSICGGFSPNKTHFPILRFTSESHRGLRDAATSSAGVELDGVEIVVEKARTDELALYRSALRIADKVAADRRAHWYEAIG
jgi:hypothetical protein